MSHLLGLRTVIYHVSDVVQAKEWYMRAIGSAPYFDEPFYVGFNVGGFELGLDPNGDGSTGAGGTTAYWGVSDVQETLNHLLQIGAELHEPAKDVGGGIRVATVRDPFGNVFGIINNPHFDIAQCS
ncbi:MAG: VOC family protein [Gemmatimonadaceae bacterium]